MQQDPAGPHRPISGVRMDRQITGSRQRSILIAVGGLLLVGGAAAGLWRTVPRGYAVAPSDVQIAEVRSGEFRDDVSMRAVATPLVSVILDAVEGGRVEKVYQRDGAMVQKGDPLFKLSNLQRQQDLLARESEVAQQVSNLAGMRVSLESSRADHQRRIVELRHDLARSRLQHQRQVALHEQGFVSVAVEEDSADLLRQKQQLFDDAQQALASEVKIRQQALQQMETALQTLQQGLELLRQSVHALEVRAPITGRLTDFQLQEGETVKAGDRLGRVDSPDQFKLIAQAAEYYLTRIALGQTGVATFPSGTVEVTVSRVNPQVKDGRFTLELVLDAGTAQSGLRPGVSADCRISLGAPAPALLLRDGGFVADTGGTWAFVVDSDGEAVRRPIQIGRRGIGQVEVLGGLRPGDHVIVSSYQDFAGAPRLKLK